MLRVADARGFEQAASIMSQARPAAKGDAQLSGVESLPLHFHPDEASLVELQLAPETETVVGRPMKLLVLMTDACGNLTGTSSEFSQLAVTGSTTENGTNGNIIVHERQYDFSLKGGRGEFSAATESTATPARFWLAKVNARGPAPLAAKLVHFRGYPFEVQPHPCEPAGLTIERALKPVLSGAFKVLADDADARLAAAATAETRHAEMEKALGEREVF